VTVERRKNKMKKSNNIGKFYYFFPQAVAMVGVAENIMPAAWHTAISAEPPLYGVLISPKRFTYELLEKSDGFTVNFLFHKDAGIIAKTGGVSGRDINKFTEFKIKFSPGEKINGPILDNAYAAYECEKFAVHKLGDHFLFVGKIVLIHFKEEILVSDQLIDVDKVKPALYFGKDRYLTTDPDSLVVLTRK